MALMGTCLHLLGPVGLTSWAFAALFLGRLLPTSLGPVRPHFPFCVSRAGGNGRCGLGAALDHLA